MPSPKRVVLPSFALGEFLRDGDLILERPIARRVFQTGFVEMLLVVKLDHRVGAVGHAVDAALFVA